MWLGVNNGGIKWFRVNDDYDIKTETRKKIIDGKKFFSMGNVNWFILGFRPEKCTQFFLGPRTSDFRPGYRNPYIKVPKRQFF